MDNLLENLNSFSVTGLPNSIHNEHPRYSQYKSKTTKSSQKERRKQVLAASKTARYDLLMHMRNVESGVEVTDEEPMEHSVAEECYKRPKKYKDMLMMSEWLEDVPEDFETGYLAVPCPVGKRCLVVCGHGKTTLYDKAGKRLECFNSVWPGGCPQTFGKGYAMFDCIVSYETNSFYIIDTMAWMNQSIMECDTLFRFEWIQTRCAEYEYDVARVDDNNTYSFYPLTYHNCDKESLTRMLQEPTCFSLDIDGILFYSKETQYTHGQTPLVGWLKPYMMDEILGIPVPENLMVLKPEKYQSLTQHIQYAKDAREQRHLRNAEISKQAKEKRKAAVEERQRLKAAERSKDGTSTQEESMTTEEVTATST